MKLVRSQLVSHLKRISCNGQIAEACFRRGLASWALTPDHLLLVDAPTVKGATKLIAKKSDEVGIVDIQTVIRSCSMIAGDDTEHVDLSLEDNRLVITEEEGSIRLLTAEPRTVATRIEEDIVTSLSEKIGDHEIPLLPSVINKVRTTFSGLRAERVLLEVGKKGGQISVGGEFAHEAHLPMPELKDSNPYTLMFGQHLIDVLTTVVETTAVLKLSGEGGVVAVIDGEYRYMLSPRSQAAEVAPPPADDDEE